ncbi:LysR family transcriptional regulator [Acinetobacter johnsonii]|uniref:LysR family transcriptional regulator n=1 Tax=Acinetobacter johnsonii TaxID=40214 RepID=UPI0021675969|nr:LysR family transcriptional regulator [Acinetobacter johnsonii]MCS3528012.1 DNA-binding transcriptional LysR family regulator [Acinetobacter johnsonii]
MDKLQCMEAFVRVAESGSFIKASEQLGVTRSVISNRIQQLENFIKAPLFHRSTRSVRLSNVGEKYYRECAALIKQFEILADEMAHATSKMQGRLRIHMAPGFAIDYFGHLLTIFLKEYPDLNIDIVVNDRIIDPIAEGFDIVFQMFPPTGESLIERKLFNVNRVLCCSPEYLENIQNIYKPEQLKEVPMGYYSGYPTRNRIRYLEEGEFKEMDIHIHVLSSSVHLLRDFALSGGGVVCLPTLVAHKYLMNKQLTTILSDYPLSNYGLRAVFPANSKNLSKIRKLLDFLIIRLDTIPSWDIELIDAKYLSEKVKFFQ